jgi:two-component system sensor histidine kinase DegS
MEVVHVEKLEEENLEDIANMSAKTLKKILRDTVENIESNKAQVYTIYENIREEVDESRKALSKIKILTNQVIEKVESLARLEQKEKQNLVSVSSNFENYSEENIRVSYERIKNVQVKLGVAREREHQLRQQRDQLELRLRKLKRTLEAAEKLTVCIGSVLGYLGMQLSGVAWQIDSAQKSRNLGAKIIKAQEEERLRVSRELHDGAAQDIANLIFQASIIERTIDMEPDEAKRGLQELRNHIRSCLKDIRQVIFDMRPMSLDDLGLVPAIRQLAAKLRERDIVNATITSSGTENKMPKHVEVGIFRIVQEALNNVNRHACVKEAQVRILFNEAATSVLITDKGKGFDPEELHKDAVDEETSDIVPDEAQPTGHPEPHYGLMGMKERARIIGGEINIVSAPGKGTRVHLRVPIKHEDDERRQEAVNKVKAGQAKAEQAKAKAEKKDQKAEKAGTCA